MNQKVVIYIILSAILLYLYYKRGDLAIFAAFVVVVAGTIFTQGSASAREGFGFGGGKGSKECAKLGFTAPKIDKKDIKGSLDKILKNFKKAVEKYADVSYQGFDIKKSGKEIYAINNMKSAMDIQTKWQEDKNNNLSEFFNNSTYLFDPYIFTPDEEKQQKFIDGKLSELVKNKEEFKKIINGGNRIVKMLEDIKKLDETKQLDKKAKAIFDVLICSIKQTVLIWKSLDKAIGGGGGGDEADEADDEEEKPKKKKKKATKKKKSKKADEDDADADAAEDDE
jgi:hypothetical protein